MKSEHICFALSVTCHVMLLIKSVLQLRRVCFHGKSHSSILAFCLRKHYVFLRRMILIYAMLSVKNSICELCLAVPGFWTVWFAYLMIPRAIMQVTITYRAYCSGKKTHKTKLHIYASAETP